MRRCAHCGEEKSQADYYKSTRYVCKKCHSKRGRERHKANPAIARESNWRNKYGIKGMTMARYEELYALQEGVCRVCRRAEPVSGRLLAVDHDHDTGEVRGLLCTKCNTTIGWIEQYPSIITYLRKD